MYTDYVFSVALLPVDALLLSNGINLLTIFSFIVSLALNVMNECNDMKEVFGMVCKELDEYKRSLF